LPSDVSQVYQVIATQAAAFAVADLCQSLGVSRSGYYAWRPRTPVNDPLTPQVRQVFARHARRYGVRRVTAELQAQGHVIGRRRVRRILRAEQLHAIQPKSFVPRTTDSRHGGRMSPNLLAGLIVTHPGQTFVSDITYLPLQNGGWAFLATWLDLYTRQIVGWCVAATMSADLIIRALRQALARAQPPHGLIAHSDRGGQYVDAEYRVLLAACGCQQSMSRAGETYDNAFAESLFSRYKAELLEGGAFRDLAEAQLETFDYIEGYYNPIRRHSALGYLSPDEFARAYAQKAQTELRPNQERIER
jgi:transposase InsO family protein